jgi:hypothetical protein
VSGTHANVVFEHKNCLTSVGRTGETTRWEDTGGWGVYTTSGVCHPQVLTVDSDGKVRVQEYETDDCQVDQ